ncbi:hypothetical protein [Floridanema evergladense]|uniref:HTH cro/C1-type domain-containing protein n=1 Tax=Floridaenema evergladense BLCC-F167 TaxID=3153639 RepID=A0ABV4WQF8_9CYAN
MTTVTPIHPKEFRAKHKLSIAQISILSGVPIETLRCWLAGENSRRKVNPPTYVNHYFGLLDQQFTR